MDIENLSFIDTVPQRAVTSFHAFFEIFIIASIVAFDLLVTLEPSFPRIEIAKNDMHRFHAPFLSNFESVRQNSQVYFWSVLGYSNRNAYADVRILTNTTAH